MNILKLLLGYGMVIMPHFGNFPFSMLGKPWLFQDELRRSSWIVDKLIDITVLVHVWPTNGWHVYKINTKLARWPMFFSQLIWAAIEILQAEGSPNHRQLVPLGSKQAMYCVLQSTKYIQIYPSADVSWLVNLPQFVKILQDILVLICFDGKKHLVSPCFW